MVVLICPTRTTAALAQLAHPFQVLERQVTASGESGLQIEMKETEQMTS